MDKIEGSYITDGGIFGNNIMAPLRCYKCGAQMGDARRNGAARKKDTAFFCRGYPVGNNEEPHDYWEVHLLG